MTLPKPPQHISNELFQVLTKEDNAGLLETIAQEHNIAVKQAGIFAAIVGHAMMHSLPLNQLAPTLQMELGIDEEASRRVALAVLLKVLYSFWPLFPDIDETIQALGGRVPSEKPAMPQLTETAETSAMAVSYPTARLERAKEAELFGGEDIPMPPTPNAAPASPNPSSPSGVLPSDILGTGGTGGRRGNDERDVAWQPQKNIARPADVSKLLEKNLIKDNDAG